MSDKYQRHFLKNKETKILLKEASEKLQVDLKSMLGEQALNIEVIKTSEAEIILANGKPIMIKTTDRVYPTLKFEEYLHAATKIIVDMGAVQHLCKGADVMAPGIKRIEGEFKNNSIVAIVDEKYKKPIAIGEMLIGPDETTSLKKGKVAKNLYYVGDKTWNLLKELSSDEQ